MTKFLHSTLEFQDILIHLLNGQIPPKDAMKMALALPKALALPYTQEEDILFRKQFDIFDLAIR